MVEQGPISEVANRRTAADDERRRYYPITVPHLPSPAPRCGGFRSSFASLAEAGVLCLFAVNHN
jgi:hypothetical protein